MSAAEEYAVDIRALSVGYRRRGRLLPVLRDVSFAIRRGEAYGLVGESGCGKTTLAMALMRYLPDNGVVESGQIAFQGLDILKAGPKELRRLRGDRMAMVYQDPASALNPSMRVGAQVAEVYRWHRGMSRQEARQAVVRMLETVQIGDAQEVARRYPHQLSGGQQQRVMFAMALATDPDLLVLDEPTTGLDATVEAEVLDLVEDLRRQFNASILFISHNLAVVARICDRVGVLYGGVLIEEGSATAVFSRPRHPYTDALVRCLPRAGMAKNQQRLESIPGALPPLGSEVMGCIYANRCYMAREPCAVASPELADVGGGHLSRCLYPSDVGAASHAVGGGPAVGLSEPGGEREVLLRIDDVSKFYRSGKQRVCAVRGVSLEIRRGEILGLVGESGSGKSTLARCIVGLTDATAGRIEFAGRVLPALVQRRDRAARRELQMVFQYPENALNPRRTVRATLVRALRLLADAPGRSERERRLLDLTESVMLSPRHLDIKPRALSGGMKQRVAIAQAFAGGPSLVLCDEPTSSLDVSVQAAVLNLLAELQAKDNSSYLFISHDLNVVRYLADRIGVMYLSELVEIGTPADVFHPPHHPYTEALVAAMATLSDGSPNKRVRLTGQVPSPARPPSGCRFHTRCTRVVGPICREQEPPWQQSGGEHMYRCHIAPADLREAQRRLDDANQSFSSPDAISTEG